MMRPVAMFPVPGVNADTAGRNGRQTQVIVQRQERFPIYGFIDDPGTATDYRLDCYRDVPGEAARGARL